MQLSSTAINWINVPAELGDEHYGKFFSDLNRCLDLGPEEIALDCSSLEIASPSHVSTLWRARSECEQAGVRMSLSSVNRNLERILKTLDIYEYLVGSGTLAVAQETAYTDVQMNEQLPELQIEFQLTVNDINRSMSEIHDYLQNLKLPDIESFELETAFYEIATNIRLHSQPGDDDTARVAAFSSTDGLVLKFIDSGPSFDPIGETTRFDPGKAIREKQRCGFGLAMVKRLVDCVHYSRERGKFNVLYMEKRFSRKRNDQ